MVHSSERCPTQAPIHQGGVFGRPLQQDEDGGQVVLVWLLQETEGAHSVFIHASMNAKAYFLQHVLEIQLWIIKQHSKIVTSTLFHWSIEFSKKIQEKSFLRIIKKLGHWDNSLARVLRNPTTQCWGRHSDAFGSTTKPAVEPFTSLNRCGANGWCCVQK